MVTQELKVLYLKHSSRRTVKMRLQNEMRSQCLNGHKWLVIKHNYIGSTTVDIKYNHSGFGIPDITTMDSQWWKRSETGLFRVCSVHHSFCTRVDNNRIKHVTSNAFSLLKSSACLEMTNLALNWRHDLFAVDFPLTRQATLASPDSTISCKPS